jgi:parvulin-like peptidyl-prolyl isomerase
LRAGQVTPPIESEYGYHVLKIIDKQEKGELQSLEQVKDEIRLKLETKKKNDRYQRFLLQVKSKFSIKTNFELLRMSPFTDSLVAAGGTR